MGYGGDQVYALFALERFAENQRLLRDRRAEHIPDLATLCAQLRLDLYGALRAPYRIGQGILGRIAGLITCAISWPAGRPEKRRLPLADPSV